MAYKMKVDFSKPVTLARCREKVEQASSMVQANLIEITIHDSEYTRTPGNECGDWAEACLRDMKYRYDKRADTVVISNKREIV